jgi:hypothetical protein
MNARVEESPPAYGDDVLKLLDTPAVQVIRLLPDGARALLELNTKNRHIRATWVNELVRVIATHQWHLTSDAVAVTRDGDLLNGQHRLSACSCAELPIDVILQTGAQSDARFATDSGIKRSLSDQFKLNGYSYVQDIAATASLHRRYSRNVNKPWPAARSGSASNRATYEEDYAYATEDHPLILQVPPVGHALYDALRGVKAAVWCTALVLCSERHAADAERFFTAVKVGADLSEGDPRLALREYAIRINGGQRSRHNRNKEAFEPNERQLATVIKAWNMWRTGKKIKALRTNVDEKFQAVR